jgi:hypothetical protein
MGAVLDFDHRPNQIAFVAPDLKKTSAVRFGD